MANTKKTSTKSTSTKAKTVPAKKPAKKPAGPSKKPAAYKEVTTKPKTTTRAHSTAKDHTKNRFCEVVFGVIIIILALAIAAGAICYFCFGRNQDVVMLPIDDDTQIPSRYVSVEDYDVKFLVPNGFNKMSEDDIEDANLAEDVEVAYINQDGSAIITLIESDIKVTNADIENHTNAIKNAVMTVGAKDATIGHYTVGDYNVGTLSYLSTSSNQKYPFCNSAYFSYEGKAISVNFQTTDAARAYWAEASDTIVKSLRFIEE